ncbi:MAG: HEAT repeat domain-containing protein [Planctomycetota bacterium]
MPKKTPTLMDLYRALIAVTPTITGQLSDGPFDRENARFISKLTARGITTLAELLEALPTLPPKLKQFGVLWLHWTRAPGTESVFLRLLHDDPAVRLTCAHALGMLAKPRTIRKFVQIGTAQLSSPEPDVMWLDAVIQGLKFTNTPEAADVILTIYERTDLPGWLRGDAGDALGFNSKLRDRRTRFFRRAWKTALSGLDDVDIEVQFWSMYVMAQLATNGRQRSNECFEPALARLREIAATDQRFAPGFWWPMCDEAKDAIEVIETGTGPQIDAAERWQGHTERGPCSKRY